MLSHDDQEFISALKESVRRLGLLPLTDSQLQQMAVHYSTLVKWNRRLNLTRITTADEAARLHYAESIYAGQFLKGAASVLDVGSGAGFPAVPLAIINGGLSVTALESNQRKSVFLKEVKDQLALSNLNVAAARIEDFNWSGYAAVASRALDRAERVYAGLLRHLNQGQILMLFCSDALLQALNRDLLSRIEMKAHHIPDTQSRFIAVFKRPE